MVPVAPQGLVTMTSTARFDTPLGADEAILRVLATTDLHMNILPYDYSGDRPANRPGLALVARAVARMRASAPNVLLVDNGDFLQGSPMGDFFGQERGLGAKDVHPMIAAMNAIGFDAGTLGNHEFNYGLDFLLRALRDARFPVVSANLLARAGACPSEDAPLFAPYALLRRNLRMGNGRRMPITLGVFGLAPPQTVDWEREALAGRVAARDMVEAAQYWVPKIRAAGADVVIALAHTGIEAARPGTDAAKNGQENAARALARVPGIDAMVLGHVHMVFPSSQFGSTDEVDGRAGTIGGTPAVMSGHSGGHLGVIDLRLRHGGPEGWRVPGARARTLDLDARDDTRGQEPPNRPTSALVRRSAAQAHAETLAHIRHPIGTAGTPVHSFFAMLGPTPAQTLVAEAQRAWFAQQPQAADFAHLPVLSIAAPFKAGGTAGPGNYSHVAPGPLTQNHAHDLYPYPNKMAALVMTGAELAHWLENVGQLYNALAPGQTGATLLPARAPAYNFDTIDGLDYCFDLSSPAQRLQGLSHAGRRVGPDDRFVVVTNTYRAAGGGGLFPALPDHRHIPVARDPSRHALVRHIARQGRIGPLQPQGGWRVTAAAGCSAQYDTSPDAVPYLPRIAAYHPEVLGTTAQGFLRLRLNF